MSVVRRTNQRQSPLNTLNLLLTGLLNGGYIDPYQTAWDVGKFIGQKVKGSPGATVAPIVVPAQPQGNNRGRKGNNPRRRRGKERKSNPGSTDAFRSIGFGPTSGTPVIRTRMTGVIELIASGTPASYNVRWMIGNHGGADLFKFLSTDSQKLVQAFEKAQVHQVSLRYVGTLASTAPGYVAIGMDSSTDTSATIPNTVSGVTNASTHVVVLDIKGEGSLTYRPTGVDKTVILSDTTATAPEWYAGKVHVVVGGHGMASGTSTSFGLLHVTVDVTLMQ